MKRNWAERRWPKATVIGEGEWASISWCPRGMTVFLYGTREEAEAAKREIARTGCSGACWKQHEVLKEGAVSRYERRRE